MSSFLLRVVQRHEERVVVIYELVELRSGRVRRFASLAALARHLGAWHGAVATPGAPAGGRKRK